MTFTSRFRSLTRSFSQFNLFASRFSPAAGTRPRGAVLRLHPGLACLALIPAVLLLSASASAQVTYTGTTAAQNFGSVNVGSASAAPLSFSFTFDTGGTLGSTAVLTQGVANLDFIDAGSGTCTANTAYNAGDTCTVNVTFKPTHSGTRYGAAELLDTSGNLLALGYAQGTGVGPLVNFRPGTYSLLPASVNLEDAGIGAAVDGSGNVFVADNYSHVVEEMLAAGGYTTIKNIGGALDYAMSVAVDGAGNVFVADYGGNTVKEIVAAGGYATVNTLGSGFSSPTAVAVDGSGNVFVAETDLLGDPFNGDVKEILATGRYTTIKTIGGALDYPSSLAVDSAGNLFVVEPNSESPIIFGSLREIFAAGGYSTDKIIEVYSDYLNQPSGVAVDGNGNLWVTDAQFRENGDLSYGQVEEFLAASGYTNTYQPPREHIGYAGVAVDGSGNLFLDDGYVEKLDYADPPSLTFTATLVGAESSDSPQTVKVLNDGNATLTLSALAYPSDFTEASGDVHACSGSTRLGAGGTCDLPIEFNPVNSGALSEAVILTDNALNVTGAQQSIAVSGTGLAGVEGATHFSVTSAASVIAGTPFSITVTALNSAGGTAITYSGTVSFTSSDPDFVNPGRLTLANGTGQATVTFQTVGTQTITATDTTTSDVTGSGGFNVVPPPPLEFTGTSASLNLGSQPVGAASAESTLSFSIGAGTTVGSIGVFTQGASNLDFTDAGGGTCAAQEYASAATCTVNVTFKPEHPGVRIGAVVFYSGAGDSGTLLGEAPIYGVGTGPQIVYPSNDTPFAVGNGFSNPSGVAVDGNGDVFVTDQGYGSNGVYEVVANNGRVSSSSTVIPMGSGFWQPQAAAVDGSGDVFVANHGIETSGSLSTCPDFGISFAPGSVDQIVAGTGGAAGGQVSSGSTVTFLGSEFNQPVGLAVDGKGDVFVADYYINVFDCIYWVPNDGAVDEIVAVNGQVSSSSTVIPVGSGFTQPQAVAVDASGDVFVADYGIPMYSNPGSVDEIVAVNGVVSSTSTVVPVGSGFKYPTGVAVDASGDVFVADSGNNAVKEIVAVNGQVSSSSTVITLGSGFKSLAGLAVDASGGVFVDDPGNSSVKEMPLATPPSLTFTNTGAGIESFDSPQTVTVSNDGNTDLTFPVPASGNNPSTTSGFTLDASTTCPELNSSSTAGTLAAGTSCTYAVDFIPAAAGTYSGSLTLTDDSLNASPAMTQTIPLTAIVPLLAFTKAPPGNLGAGIVPGTVVVSVEDASSNVETTSSATITLAVSGPNSYSHVYTATALSGVATFSSLASLNVPGSYSYAATDAPDGFTQAVASETVTAQGPFGKLDKAEDSVTFSTTVGQSGSVEITGWVADPQDGAPMSNVKVYIDGTSIGTPTLGIAVPAVAALRDNDAYLLSGYQMLYPASSLSVGTHQVTVIAIDSLGLSTTFGPVSFTVAAAAGVGVPFGVLSPAADSVTSSTTVGQSNSVNIQGWVGDPQDHAPLTNVTVYIDGASIGAPTLGIARPAVASLYGSAYLNSGYQLLHPASSLSLGSHSVTVIATDAGGRSTTFGPVTFTVAAVAGAGSPFGILGEAVDSVTLSTTVSQSDSVKISGWVIDRGNTTPITNVTVYIDGTSIGTPTLGLSRPTVAADYGSSYRNSGYQMLYPASSLSQGAHSATVVAIDSGDRSTTFGPVEFTVQ